MAMKNSKRNADEVDRLDSIVSAVEELPSPSQKRNKPTPAVTTENQIIAVGNTELGFIGEPFSSSEAKNRWPNRYRSQEERVFEKDDATGDQKPIYQAKCHYKQAIVDQVVFDLFDDAYVSAEEGKPDYICRIVEMFTTVKDKLYIAAQWFYRAEDTVIKHQASLIDSRRVFFSYIIDDNELNCIQEKVKIVQLPPTISPEDREKELVSADLYFDMRYSLKYFTFKSANEDSTAKDQSLVAASMDAVMSNENGELEREMNLLDVYSGCGALSSGLCLGAAIGGVKLNHRWAVDFNKEACESLEMNHPKTKVRNEDADDFLELVKAWDTLCNEYQTSERSAHNCADDAEENVGNMYKEHEVEKFLAICYRDPNKTKDSKKKKTKVPKKTKDPEKSKDPKKTMKAKDPKKSKDPKKTNDLNSTEKKGLYLKVRWKGNNDPRYDTWEHIDCLSNCREIMKEFVIAGCDEKILPRPGEVDFLCGGPPCQGLSGHNRFRHTGDPLKDPKNEQIIVFMNLIKFLKPKYVLMENVADMLKFQKGIYFCFALGGLVSLQYQTRLGIMAAGAYGVSQCRMRVFLWASQPTERLPHFPLPTHEVSKKGVVINDFKECVVSHEGGRSSTLQKSIVLEDAISDLPEVKNDAQEDVMEYDRTPITDFQKYIRLRKDDIFINDPLGNDSQLVYEHRPLHLNPDDFERVCFIPKIKGANSRHFPGLEIGKDKRVRLVDGVERLLCKSGVKFLVPDYVLSFEDGKSTKCFGRLAMDDIVATVVTRAEPHNQAIIHPKQDRVLTVRENARLQGFPDCYRLYGHIKERYKQVGNAVSFSVSIPLGYSLAKAKLGEILENPFELPFKFPDCLGQLKDLRKYEDGESSSRPVEKN